MTREQLDALKVDLSDYANWAPTTRILVLQMFEEYASQRALTEQQAKKIADLEDSLRKLDALERAGVDNWDGYGDAMESME